jgi:predicted phage tail component-like protein
MMIYESLYFSFAGRRSTDFGIMNVSVSSGLYEEPFLSRRNIKETYVRGRYKPYFIEVEREPKTFQLSFVFEETWNDQLIREVARWLNVDYYEPLSFSENMDIVYYAMPVDDIPLIHNGLKQGYLTLTMRCDSPFAYSHDQVTPWYDFSSNQGKGIIEILNYGDAEIYPEIFIQKVENGDITITNLSKANSDFVLTGLLDQEELYIHCENEIIETNLPNIWRYDSFNDNYLSLVYGTNILEVTGKCKIKFRYRFKFL